MLDQLGLLDPQILPVAGESAAKVFDPTLRSNALMSCVGRTG